MAPDPEEGIFLMSMRTSRVPRFPRIIGVILMVLLGALTGTAASASPGHDFSVVKTVDVKVNPFGDTTAPDGKTIWVANSGPVGASGTGSEGHTVTVLDAHTATIQSIIDVGVFPEDITFAHGGRQALVTNSTSGTVSVIDTATRTVTQTIDLSAVNLTFPFGIVATKDSSKVYVTTLGNTSPASIGVLNDTNPAHVTIESTIGPAGFANRPALTPDGRLLVVPFSRPESSSPPETLLIDTRTDQVTGDLQLTTPGAPQAATVAPDGRFGYVSIFGGEYYGGTGGIWVIDLAKRSTVAVIQTPDAENEGVNVTPDGKFVFATDFSIGEVSVLSTATNQIVANVKVGDEPNESAFTPDSRHAFVTNQGDTTVSVISIHAAS
jgi:YVTN family beta-propeller protein